MLKLIGYWKSNYTRPKDHPNTTWVDDVPEYPTAQSLVDPHWCVEERQKCAVYLNAGLTYELYRGYSYCRFDCHKDSEEHLGDRDFTDGVWVWPEGLGHYVEIHSVRLPDEFLTHVARNNFRMPESFDEGETKVDHEFWIKWAKAKTTT